MATAWVYVPGTINAAASGRYFGGVRYRRTNTDSDMRINNRTVLEVEHYIGVNTAHKASWTCYNNYDNTSYYKIDGSQQNTTTRFDFYKVAVNSSGYSLGTSYAIGDHTTVTPKGEPKSYTVYHDSSGAKSIALYCYYYCGISSSIMNITTSKTIVLPSIDRSAPTISIAASTITTSSLKVTANINKTVDLVQRSLNGGTWTTDDYTITGLSANTSYTVRYRVRRTDNQVYGYSNTLTMQTHPTTVQPASYGVNTITAHSAKVYTGSNTPANTGSVAVMIDGFSSWTIVSGSSITKEYTGLQPNTTYTARVSVKTKRSLVWGTEKTITFKTLQDTFCYKITSNNIKTGPFPMYMITSNGTKTEIKKEAIGVL